MVPPSIATVSVSLGTRDTMRLGGARNISSRFRSSKILRAMSLVFRRRRRGRSAVRVRAHARGALGPDGILARGVLRGDAGDDVVAFLRHQGIERRVAAAQALVLRAPFGLGLARGD